MDRTEMKERLKKKLTPKRFEHSLGVEYVAGCLAMVYDIDVERALVAGLLHDCAKCIPAKEKIRKCEKNKLSVSDVERANPELLHAKLGAFYAHKKYDICDKEILSAIECHTTGKPAMTTLEKIIFVADYIEPNRRKLPEIEEIRHEAFSDIDICVEHILRSTLTYLKDQKAASTDDLSVATYDYYKKLNESNRQGD
jgi:predicted HD superfamily hydrolase involved in NAD metabolism